MHRHTGQVADSTNVIVLTSEDYGIPPRSTAMTAPSSGISSPDQICSDNDTDSCVGYISQALSPVDVVASNPDDELGVSPTSTAITKSSHIFTPDQVYSDNDTNSPINEGLFEPRLASPSSDISHEDRLMQYLESKLRDLLVGHLGLAAIIIPEIHDLTRAALLRDEQICIDGGESSSAQQRGTSKSLSQASPSSKLAGVSPSTPKAQKRPRAPNDSDHENERPRRKMREPELLPDGSIFTFACHFFKSDPIKYDIQNDWKYRTCRKPRVPMPGLRRIK